MMEKPPAYDLADPWTKLKEQDGDLTFKGSKGVREYFAKRGIEIMQECPKHIDEYSNDDPDNTEYIVTKAELIEAIKVAQEMAYKEGYAQCKQDQHREKLTTKDILQLVSKCQRERCETGRI